MTGPAEYPKTRYAPSPLVDLASKAERERLSPSAVRAFFNLVERWKIRDDDAKVLLGGDHAFPSSSSNVTDGCSVNDASGDGGPPCAPDFRPRHGYVGTVVESLA